MTASKPRSQTIFRDKNIAIVERIQAGNDDAYQELYSANIGLITYFAKRYSPLAADHRCVDFDDLVQAGYIGIHIAAKKYDTTRGASFSTLAAFYIKKEMRRALGLGARRNPADTAVSLDVPIRPDDADSATLGDMLAAEQEPDHLEVENLREAVRAAILRIEDDEIRCAIWERYWSDETQSTRAAKYCVTVGVISYNVQKAHNLLRKDAILRKWAVIYGYIKRGSTCIENEVHYINPSPVTDLQKGVLCG